MSKENIASSSWTKVRLDSLCDILIGGTPARNETKYWECDENEKNVWLSIADLSKLKGKYIDDSAEYISNEGVCRSNVKKIQPGTVLMSFKLSIGKVAIAKRPLYTNEAIAAFEIKQPEKIISDYLYYVLPTLAYETDQAVKGKTLNKEKLKSVQLNLPSVDEQRKIANILTSVDEDIQKTNEIISVTEKLRDGLMQEFFTGGIGHTKFKKTVIGHIPESWSMKTLHQIARVERGKFSHRPRNAPEFYGGDIPFIQTGDVVNSNGKISLYTQTLNEKGLSVSKLFKKGTIVITIAANIGDTGILQFDSCFPDSLIGITPSEEVDAVFLEYYLRTQKNYLNSIATQSAQKNINLEKLNPLLVVLPPKLEQEKIASILSSMDEKILVNRLLSRKITELKEGLMQDLLNGKVRTQIN